LTYPPARAYSILMDKTLANQIKTLRARLGVNTQGLAERLGKMGAPTSWRSIEGWEEGRRAPRPEAMEALVALGLREGVK